MQLEDEVEFFLILQFDCLDSVKTFAGADYKTSYIPKNAKRVLLKYQATAEHYEFRKELLL